MDVRSTSIDYVVKFGHNDEHNTALPRNEEELREYLQSEWK